MLDGGKPKDYIVQSIEMGNERNDKVMMNIAEHKLALVMDMDPSSKHGKYVDCMTEYYKSGNRFFCVHNFHGHGYKDLYMLANIKGAFTE